MILYYAVKALCPRAPVFLHPGCIILLFTVILVMFQEFLYIVIFFILLYLSWE